MPKHFVWKLLEWTILNFLFLFILWNHFRAGSYTHKHSYFLETTSHYLVLSKETSLLCESKDSFLLIELFFLSNKLLILELFSPKKVQLHSHN